MSADADKPKEIAPFLRSLRRLLDTEHASVVCWTADGVAFEIHDLAQLVAHVLPKYFKHAKYSSFQRQLNYFHFRKWTRSKTAVCTFSNPHFQRDAPELAWRISRKKSAPAAAKTVTSASAAVTGKTASAAARALAIVVPKSVDSPQQQEPKHAAFDGLMSPTDAAAMVHHSCQPLYHQPEAPLALAAPWQELAWPSQPALLPDPIADAELLPLDWIDSLYSSLDAAPARGGLAL